MVAGSSPLARGLPPADGVGGCPIRIIPARAGFTGRGRRCCSAGRDHPRSRGVYRRGPPGRGPCSGSSPLARGLLGHAAPLREELGIIPARAGFTLCARWHPGGRQDHPRSRGVYFSQHTAWGRTRGSSPLARGLPRGWPPRGGPRWIIPARAGFTAAGAPGRSAAWDHPRSRGVYCGWRSCTAGTSDHPRSRGVYAGSPIQVVDADGSSPLARGLQPGHGVVHLLVGIIPARAGFTPGRRGQRPAAQDHPRSRGVYYRSANHSVSFSGSSPLARGLPAAEMPAHTHRRIIPARAGFTPLRSGHPTTRTDHPRSRGVYGLTQEQIMEVRGSSPLARGLPCPRARLTRMLVDHPRSRGVY